MVDGHLAPHDLQDQLFGLVDAVVHAGEEYRLAVKAGSLHVLVRRHDDAVAGRDLFAGQDILGTVGTVGLDLHRQLQFGARLGQCLGGHVGVGDAVGAGRHSQHPEAILRDGLVGEALAAELCFLRSKRHSSERCEQCVDLRFFGKPQAERRGAAAGGAQTEGVVIAAGL